MYIAGIKVFIIREFKIIKYSEETQKLCSDSHGVMSFNNGEWFYLDPTETRNKHEWITVWMINITQSIKDRTLVFFLIGK